MNLFRFYVPSHPEPYVLYMPQSAQTAHIPRRSIILYVYVLCSYSVFQLKKQTNLAAAAASKIKKKKTHKQPSGNAREQYIKMSKKF